MSFLSDYALYCTSNEAPEIYHIWSALSAISAIVGRRVWIEKEPYEIFTNIYVILVGAPGDGKTTAMSVCKALLRNLGDIPISASATTKEALVQVMAENQKAYMLPGEETPYIYSPMTICVTEFSQFVGNSTQAPHMLDLLTTIYDERVYEYRTKTKKEGQSNHEILVGPYLTILGCAIPEWITSQVREEAIQGGFSRRAIFVMGNGRSDKCIPFPTINVEQAAAMDRVVCYAKKLKELCGLFTWGPGAREAYASWYTWHKKNGIPRTGPLVGYFSTKPTQILKVSLLWSLGESLNLVLTKETFDKVLALFDMTEREMGRVFDGMGANVFNRLGNKIVELLVRAGQPLQEKKVIKELIREASIEDLQKTITELVQTEKIRKLGQEVKDERTGNTTMIIYLWLFGEEVPKPKAQVL